MIDLLLPPGSDARQVPVIVDGREATLRVLHSGVSSGTPPAVLIHGGGTDNAGISWYRLFEPLGERLELWAPDLPGFGGSIHLDPVGGPKALAGLVAAVMDAVGIGRAVVMGVSMGGDVALNLALDHPERVERLVLIGPGGLAPLLRNRVAQWTAWAAAQLPDPVMLPASYLANRLVGAAAVQATVNDPSRLPQAVLDEFIRTTRDRRGALGYLRYNQATLGPWQMTNDLTSRVHAITAPTLFFHGEDDRMVNPLDSARAAARMPEARLALVPGCGHWAQLEAHDRFLAELTPFLEATNPD